MEIRDFRVEDARQVVDVFQLAVRRGARGIYEPRQLEAWAPEPPNYADWERNLLAKPPFVALRGGNIVGFMTLEANGHIDWTYTHPDHQRQGVATALYAHLEREARRGGLCRLYVEASKMARPFFTKQGFVVVQENQICRGTISLTNWTMEKLL
jgi:putative acetyltransferase